MGDDAAAATGEEAIADARRIRALAHPLRIELLDVLSDAPEGLTATQCATRTGESVASSSFHLRTLARYGYIEPGARRGREKPWRLVSRGHDFRSALGNPSSLAALEEMISHQTDYQFARIRESIHTLGNDTPDWRDASTLASAGFWATAAELGGGSIDADGDLGPLRPAQRAPFTTTRDRTPDQLLRRRPRRLRTRGTVPPA